MDGWNTSFLLGWPIFRGYVSFRECICFQIWCLEVQQTLVLMCMLQKSFEQKYCIIREKNTDTILPYCFFWSSFINSRYTSVKTFQNALLMVQLPGPETRPWVGFVRAYREIVACCFFLNCFETYINQTGSKRHLHNWPETGRLPCFFLDFHLVSEQ